MAKNKEKFFRPPKDLQAAVAGRLITRFQAADILQISRSELRRRELEGIYPYLVDKRGWHWFDEGALRQISGTMSFQTKEVH